jgi:hypothetical protein
VLVIDNSVLILANCKPPHLAPWVSNRLLVLVLGVMAIFSDHLTPCDRAPRTRSMCGVLLSGGGVGNIKHLYSVSSHAALCGFVKQGILSISKQCESA